MKYYTSEQIAHYMAVSPKSFKRWWQRLGVPPDKCAPNGQHRWSTRQLLKFLRLWRTPDAAS